MMDLVKLCPHLIKVIGKGNKTSILNDPWCNEIPILYKPTFINVYMMQDGKVEDLIRGSYWNYEELEGQCAPHLIHGIRNIHFDSSESDKWIQAVGFIGLPITKSVYKTLLENSHQLGDTDINCKRLWEMKLPPRIKLFGWKLLHRKLHRKLPTKDKLMKLGIIGDTACVLAP